MKKIFLLLTFMCFTCFMFVPDAFSDRNAATVTAYSASALIKSGEGSIYSISFVATANNGGFIIYDALTPTAGGGSDLSEIKAEGKEATSGNSQFQDYSDKPLEFSTGLYLSITSGYVIIAYE